jgi:hypothetical protein
MCSEFHNSVLDFITDPINVWFARVDRHSIDAPLQSNEANTSQLERLPKMELTEN